MELLQLKYFCYAAECESFSLTAKHFRVPSSGISQTIKRLEEELKTPLFTRKANKIIINEQGKIFYNKIKKALDSIDEAKLEISDFNSYIKGEIKILILSNRRIVTGAIEKFRAEYKDVSFVINHSSYADITDFDIVVADEEMADGFEKHIILTEDIVIAMNSKNPLLKKEKITPKDLKKEKYITMSEGSSICNKTRFICGKMGFEPNIVIQTDDPFYVRKYVELNMGIAFVPELTWQGMFSDKISFKKIGKYKRNTCIFFNKNKYVSKAVCLFAETLSDYIKEKVN